MFYLGLVNLTFISLVGYVNFQVPKEKEVNVASSLEMMNVSRFASEASFIVIQQPAMLARLLIVALGKYTFPLFSDDAKSVF